MSTMNVAMTETEQLIAEGAVALIDQRDLIVASGPEAVSYLHGQVSQTVSGLAVGESAWTLLLQPQGKVDAWLRLTRLGEETIALDLDAGHGQHALARLERFKLRTKATLVLQTVKRIAIRGPLSPAPPAPEDGVVVAELEWPGVKGFDLLGDEAEVPDDLPVGDADALEILRIRLGMPAMGNELTESTIPAEAGIVDLSVDFTKGCYVGQELVARVDSRGNNTPRRIHRLILGDAGQPAVGSAVRIDGEDIGVVTSSATGSTGSVALASIKRAADITRQAEVDTDQGAAPVGIEAIDIG